MTVDTSDNRISYAGNGTTTTFSFPYKFFANSDLVVTEVDDVTSAESTKVLDTDYTVTGAGEDAGGSVEATTAPASGKMWVIERVLPLRQGLDLVENDPLPAEEVEKAFDRNVMMAQQNANDIARTAQLPTGYTGSFDPTLPTDITADTALVVNATGDGFATGPTTTAISNAQTDATAAAASAAAAATSEANAATSETNAAASEAAAAAAAAGWSDVVSITSGTTDVELTDANTYYIIDASAGTVTINMPAVADTDGRTYGFEVLDATNAITIAGDGTDTINGVAGDYTSLTGVGDVVHFISVDGTPDDWSARLISRFVVDDVTIQQSGRTISIKEVKANVVVGEVQAQTGTTYTTVAGDAYKPVTLNNASAVAVTVPDAVHAVGDRIDFYNLGAGEVTVQLASGQSVQGGGASITSDGSTTGKFTLAQGFGASIHQIAADTWFVVGGTVV